MESMVIGCKETDLTEKPVAGCLVLQTTVAGPKRDFIKGDCGKEGTKT